MNNTARFVIALLLTGAMAALATPELSSKLPQGIAQVLVVACGAVLHKMNAEGEDKCEEHSSDSSSE